MVHRMQNIILLQRNHGLETIILVVYLQKYIGNIYEAWIGLYFRLSLSSKIGTQFIYYFQTSKFLF